MDAIALHALQRLRDRRERLVRSLACPGAQPELVKTERLPPGYGGELAAIDEALGRIEEGVYGRCLFCGGAIGGQRLLAIPEARLCVDCSAKSALAW